MNLVRGQADMAVAAFVALRAEFFDNSLQPIAFRLRDKRNTQDDPLDEHIADRLRAQLPEPLRIVKTRGPLISPDMVVATPAGVREIRQAQEELGTPEAVGIEVKKLERASNGAVARRSGIDYNTTPPSSTISVYYERNRIHLPGFYLFVCLEGRGSGCRLTALALCDGGVLNEDVALYSRITSGRQKAIGLGSYGDGVDRQRPMLIFANPLGWSELDRAVTLIHRSQDLGSDQGVVRIGTVERSHPNHPERISAYAAYRLAVDVPRGHKPFVVRNPFPAVTRRSEITQSRGQFHLDFSEVL